MQCVSSDEKIRTPDRTFGVRIFLFEFRIFRGTLKYNTLIATLQLVERICSVATVMSDDQLKDMPWTTFVVGCTAPELVQYLKERRLYVNEVTEGEEEV